jgi:hypothetical protein
LNSKEILLGKAGKILQKNNEREFATVREPESGWNSGDHVAGNV